MQRNDIHSPTNFEPADYTYEFSFDAWPDPNYPGYDPAYGKGWQLIDEHGAHIHCHDGITQCDHCGARIRYISIFRHKSGEVIAVGTTCANERFGCDDRRSYDIKRLKEVAASLAERNRVMGKAAKFMEEKAPDLAGWMLSPKAKDVHPIFFEMSSKLVKYGSLSDKQLAFAAKLLDEHFQRQRNEGGKTDREIAIAAEREAAAPVPVGRHKVTGVILKGQVHESAYGPTYKITVKDDRGFVIWMTCPAGIPGNKGDRVVITATLEASERDPKFGFGKRPVPHYNEMAVPGVEATKELAQA